MSGINQLQFLINAVNENPLLSVLLVVFGIFDAFNFFVEFFDNGKPVKSLVETVSLVVVTVVLCIWLKPVIALLVLMVVVLLLVLCNKVRRGWKRNQQVKKAMNNGETRLSCDMELTVSWRYKQASDCVKEERPREAIAHLLRCKGKITGKPKFFITYADALMQLDNFLGAQEKLNAIPSKKLSKKSTFVKVTVRKAYCYHCLHEYAQELRCYDSLLARDIQPEVFYFRRAQVKMRMLETCSYLKPVQQAIASSFGTQQEFIMSMRADLDRAQHNSGHSDGMYRGKILSYQGASYVCAGDYHEGQRFLMEAKEENEFFANTYIYLGICQYHNKEIAPAIDQLQKAIDHDEEANTVSEMAFYYLAKIYYEIGEYDDAISYATRSLSIFPYRSDCFYIQGKCYQKKLMYNEAVECFTKAINLKSKATYYNSRAHCYFVGLGKNMMAYRDMCKAIKLKDCVYYQVAALLYKLAMDTEKGIKRSREELGEMVASYQDDPDYFNTIGNIYYEYKYYEDSEIYYRKEIEAGSKFYGVYYNLALVLQGQGKIEEAIDELKIAIELEPMDIKAYDLLIACYQKLGDVNNEIQIRIKLRDIKHLRCQINKKNGDAVYQLGKYQAAVGYYKAALGSFSSAAALNNISCAYYKLEMYTEAIESLEKAIKLDKEYSVAYFNLGNCQLRVSERENSQSMRKAAKQNFQVAARSGFKPASQMLESMNEENIQMVVDVELG